MIKVLHILSSVDFGGMSSVVVNYYKHIDRDKIQFDIALTTDSFGKDGETLKELGANFYRIPMKSENRREYKKQLSELLKKNNYDGIHVHENETSFFALQIAKNRGVKRRIVHAHTSSPYINIRSEIRRMIGCVLNYHYSTTAIACGELAAKRVFGTINYKRKKCVILPNAIEIERFKFNDGRRIEIRKALNLQDKYVVGMVGRFSCEKNYAFAIELTKKLKNNIENIILVCIGDGDEMSNIRQLVKLYSLEDKVLFLGKKSNIQDYYQAFDVQIMPSFHEGFPVAAVEGLCSGLKVIMSDTITPEFSVYENCVYLPINDIEKWEKEIINISCHDKRNSGEVIYNQLKTKLDIGNTKNILEQIYST